MKIQVVSLLSYNSLSVGGHSDFCTTTKGVDILLFRLLSCRDFLMSIILK